MRVISFNANGLRSAAKKGFFEWFQNQSADFLCLQEIKAHTCHLVPHEQYYPENYVCEYAEAEKKGYSGVGLFARTPPLRIVKSFGYEQADVEGRYIRFDYETLSVISIYFPSGTTGDARQSVKYEFMEYFMAHLHALKAEGRSLVIAGDYNIAHTKKDIENWRGNQKHSGFLPAERAWMTALLTEHGMVDAFRVANQEPKQYTWWSNRGRAYENNVGWRIDYQMVTQDLGRSVLSAAIARDAKLSDHAPLTIDYKFGALK